jgi:hypothetical protein
VFFDFARSSSVEGLDGFGSSSESLGFELRGREASLDCCILKGRFGGVIGRVLLAVACGDPLVMLKLS